MGDKSAIEWTDATFNPVWGCTKVSPGCDHCYAEKLSARYGFDVWGPGKPRREFGDKHWAEPLKWNAAAKAGERKRVFCASMADVFDKDWPDGTRERLWALIEATPHLDWLLLTKRIGNAAKMLPLEWGDGWPNVWLGASIVNQEEADRDIPKLLAVPARVRFLSCEPLLGAIKFRMTLGEDWLASGLSGERRGIDWVIVGGESGPGARPISLEWVKVILDQCRAAGVACFVKQLGAFTLMRENGVQIKMKDRKGGDPSEWHPALRVREFPAPLPQHQRVNDTAGQGT